MGVTLSQKSFAGGEISPDLYARTDLVKYHVGARKITNAYVMRHGGVTNRPGTEWVGYTNDSTKRSRLIPFIKDKDTANVFELGDLYLRNIASGDYAKEAAKTITNITNANPAVVSVAAHSYSVGDVVVITGVVGNMASYINGRWFKVNTVPTANTFSLKSMAGVAIDSTSFGSYTSGGSCKRVYTAIALYAESVLQDIKYDQKDATVTFVHPNSAPFSYTRASDTSITIASGSFAPDTALPRFTITETPSAGTKRYEYMVTGVSADGEESFPGLSASARYSISGITNANPASVTANFSGAHQTGDIIWITGVAGTTEINNKYYTITRTGLNTCTLNGVDSSLYGVYSGSGSDYIYMVTDAAVISVALSAAECVTINITNADDYAAVRVYKRVEEMVAAGLATYSSTNVFGYLGTVVVPEGVSSVNFYDTGALSPSLTQRPPIRFTGAITFDTLAGRARDNGDVDYEPWDPQNYPSCVGYVQQRLGFGGSTNYPAKVMLSKIKHYHNFTRYIPMGDDDYVEFDLVGGRTGQKIQDILDVDGRFILFTDRAAWFIQGDADGIITPSGINPKKISGVGCSDLSPLVIDKNAIFIQSRGSAVRELFYDNAADTHKGELSRYVNHLIENYEITDWAYQEVPHSIVWMVRDDGTVLSMTYVKDEQIIAWATHDFGGIVENVAVVPEGDYDAVYFVIKRTINSATVRYVEKLSTRTLDDIVEANFTDCSLTYDGRHTGSTTMTLSGGTDWDYEEELTLTASVATFATTYVGNQIHLTGSDGTVIRFTISSYTNTTVVKGYAHMTVPSSMRSVAITTWAYAVDVVTGLWHLEGEDVSVYADGAVVSNPNNLADGETALTVTNGSITLPACYGYIRVGLPYISDIETLDIDMVNNQDISDSDKLVSDVVLNLVKTRGVFVGRKPPTDDDDDPLEDLNELRLRDQETMEEVNDLYTGKAQIKIESAWNSNGRVFIRQVDPLPMTIAAVHPVGNFPATGGG